ELLGQPRRSCDIDEQYEAVLLHGRMIASGDEVQESPATAQVGDAENEVEKNRYDGRIDKAVPVCATGHYPRQAGDGLAELKPLQDTDDYDVNGAPDGQ